MLHRILGYLIWTILKWKSKLFYWDEKWNNFYNLQDLSPIFTMYLQLLTKSFITLDLFCAVFFFWKKMKIKISCYLFSIFVKRISIYFIKRKSHLLCLSARNFFFTFQVLLKYYFISTSYFLWSKTKCIVFFDKKEYTARFVWFEN